MKKEQFDFKKANARKREIGDRLNELAEKLDSKEELTEEQREEIRRESLDLRGELDSINMQSAAALAYMAAEQQGREVTRSRNEVFRELLNDIRSGKRHEREISLSVLTEGAKNNIVSAGADKVTVQDIMPNLSEGLIWDKVGMKVQTGVAGNLVWPYATDNVKIVEVGVCDRREARARRSPKETVDAARAGIGSGGYSLLHNNCEHFAYLCAFGVKKCTAEEEARKKWNLLGIRPGSGPGKK